MRVSNFKSATIKSALAATLLLSGGGAALAQSVSLTAAPTSTTLSDGSVVPMWGYSCGAVSNATCTALNPTVAAAQATVPPSAPASAWSPVVITVPYSSTGTNLTINLTNNLTFANSNTVPTSLVIVGQIGGGLGSTPTTTPSPDHSTVRQQTWPIVTGATAPAPAQGSRVQSFGTEVAAGATTTLTWNNLLPGTYLIESGTHPSIQAPMGLYGILVVTDAANGVAYPAVTKGTPTAAVNYSADVPLLFSEIDPVQNQAVATAVNTAGFSETKVWSGLVGGCGNPASPVGTVNTCYPPTVNYTPLYYLINGRTFDTTNAAASLFPVNPLTGATAPVTGTVLVRLVNAGSKMHVPSIVGSQTTAISSLTKVPAVATVTPGMALVAEDGNVLPGLTRVQNEVFMAAGKTYDVMINAPAACTVVAPATTCANSALPIYDRELSLSANATARDGGMLAYIGINGAGLPAAAAPTANTPVANPDSYNALLGAGQPLVISDPSKGVIGNDVHVYGVSLLTQAGNGTVVLNSNGTFTYTPTAGSTATSDSFTYCANGSVAAGVCSSNVTATVTLGAAAIEAASGITCSVPSPAFTSTATTIAIKPPGVLGFCKDVAGYALTVDTTSVSGAGFTVNADGSFTATSTGAGTASFSFKAKNSQGTVATAAATVTVAFPAPSNLTVTVVDGSDHTTPISDYRWIIEEDRTFYVDPACTTNPLPPGCPTIASGNTNPINYGTNFHTSFMPVIASGCTGTLSCEGGQTLQGAPVVCDVGNGACRTTGSQQAVMLPGSVSLDPSKRYYISVLPGDAANPFNAGYLGAPDCSPAGAAAGHCGHGMGGAPIPAACGPQSATKTACVPGATGGFAPVTVLAVPTPLPSATLSVIVYQDDYPLNGEQGAGGGIDVMAPQEAGLGDFQITIFDQAGQTGAATGTPTYDMSNQPLSNALAGTIDPVTGLDACPISAVATANAAANQANPTAAALSTATSMIVTCPKYEGDGKTLSPMAGQALVKNLYPGRYGVSALPGASSTLR